MKYFFKIILFIFTLNFTNLTQVLANDVYFIDYAKVMNESKAGKKAQDNLKKILITSNKKFNETAKKLKEEEKKIVSQKNVLTKEDYKKKVEELRKKVFSLNKERDKSIRDIASKRKKAGDEMLKNLNPILGKYMEENSITLVIDKKNVLMGNKKFEITSQIIEILNKDLQSLNLN
jgi:outer membrane protein